MNAAAEAVSLHGAVQEPREFGLLLDVVQHVIRAGLILEIGSWRGGTLYGWASTGARVVAVTLPETAHLLDSGAAHGAQMIYGDSHKPDTAARIRAVLDGEVPGFAFIDGDHSYAGAQADLDLCLSLGIPVIGMHDVSLVTEPGVRRVWKEACARWPHMLIECPSSEIMGTGIIWPEYP